MGTPEQLRVAALVREYGHAVVLAEGYAYTAGTGVTYVVAGLGDELAAQVLQRAVRGVQIFGEYEVRYLVADPTTLDLEGARTESVLQVLWPDVYGVFPDEDRYRGAEQVLYT